MVNLGLLEKSAGGEALTFSAVPFDNRGILRVRQGLLSFNGGLKLDDASQIELEVAGPDVASGLSSVHAAGALLLDGSMRVTLMGGYFPDGESLDLVTASSIIGEFDSFECPQPGDGLRLNPAYGATGIVTTAVPLKARVLPGSVSWRDGHFQFEVYGVCSEWYAVEASPTPTFGIVQIVDTRRVDGTARFLFVDPDPERFDSRYYRLRHVP